MFGLAALHWRRRSRGWEATTQTLREERDRAERRAAELTTLLAEVPVELWAVDESGRFVAQSRLHRERYGDALGRTVEELALPEPVRAQSDGDHRRVLGGEFVCGDVDVTIAGRTSHMHRLLAPRRIQKTVTGAIGVAVDVTERRRAEEALWHSQQRLRLHMENTPLAVIDWSADGKILSWNAAAENVFGWQAVDVLGKDARLFFSNGQLAAHEEAWRKLLAGDGGASLRARNMTREGRELDCEWYHTALVDPQGQAVGVSSIVLDVSDRLNAEDRIRESEERFQHVFEASSVAKLILRRADGRIINANARLLLMLERRREDVQERTLAGIALWERPEDGETFLRLLERDGEVRDREFRLKPRVGPPVDVVVFAAQVRLGGEMCVLVTLVDNVERKSAEHALRESQRFLSVLIGHLPGMVYRCRNDRRWTMTFVSDGATELTGYSSAELEHGRAVDFAELIHPDDRERVWHDTQHSLDSGRNTFSFEYRLRRRDGEERWVWERGEALNESAAGNDVLVGFITDITERKRAEEEVLMLNLSLERRVGERTAELGAAYEQLKQLDRLKSEFLATMSHELRTPLNSIIGFSSILRQGLAGPLNDEQTKQIDMVRGSAKHLLSLINDLLDLSRIESGRMALTWAVFDLPSLLREVEAVLAPMVAQRGLRLSLRPPEGALEIESDRQRLYQVLLNLGGNAVKFTETGTVTLEWEVSGNEVSIRVIDTGIGIRPENMGLLFEAFRQVDGSARRVYEGTGLGLYLCRQLIDLLGGTIGVASTYGQGSCFTVKLPLKRIARRGEVHS